MSPKAASQHPTGWSSGAASSTTTTMASSISSSAITSPGHANDLTGFGSSASAATALLAFAGTYPNLYHNAAMALSMWAQIWRAGEERSKSPMTKSFDICPIDIDRDGLIDIIVANDTVRIVFHNKAAGNSGDRPMSGF